MDFLIVIIGVMLIFFACVIVALVLVGLGLFYEGYARYREKGRIIQIIKKLYYKIFEIYDWAEEKGEEVAKRRNGD